MTSTGGHKDITPGLNARLRYGQADAQILTGVGGYAVVRDGVFVEWVERPYPELVTLNSMGLPVHVDDLAVEAAREAHTAERIERYIREEHEHIEGVTDHGTIVLNADRIAGFSGRVRGVPHSCITCSRLNVEAGWALARATA